MIRAGAREPLAWFLAGLVVLLANWAAVGRAILSNDSYQYLSEAANLRAGNGLRTSILFYHENYYTGTLPAPQTVFPPGYPLAIALLGLVGVPLETAGVVVSVLASAGLLPLLILGGRLLGIHPMATRAAAFLLLCNATGWFLALSVLSEALFTFLTGAALLLLLRAEVAGVEDGCRTRWLLGGALLAAFGFWVRYAGLFLLAAIGLYYLGKLIVRHYRRSLFDVVLVGLPTGALTAMALVRNHLLSGHFQGGNTNAGANSFRSLWSAFKSTLVRLGCGTHTTIHDLKPPSLLGVLFVLLVGLLVVGFIWYVVRNRTLILGKLKTPGPLLLSLYLVTYTAGLFYAGKRTPIDFDDPRMFYPVLPVVLLLVGLLFPQEIPAPRVWKSKLAIAVLLLGSACLYATLQIRSWLRSEHNTLFDSVRRQLMETVADGVSVQGWLEQHVSPDDAVLATEGQACGYLWQRKTIALGGLVYCKEPWTEERVLEVSEHYHARYLIVFPQTNDTQRVSAESPFLAHLLDGDLPAWIHPAVRTPGCRVYRLTPDSR